MLANGSANRPANDERKVIVRQLDFNTSKGAVHAHFSQYGGLDDVVMKFNDQGKSKGFCFVIFSDISTLNNVLQAAPHNIDGKEVMVQKAIPRTEQNKTKKLFCGGLPHGLTEDLLRTYFTQYGEIANFEFVFDKQTGQRKHFCFVVFVDPESVEKVTEGKLPPKSVLHYIEKFRVECKKKFEDNHPLQKKIKESKSEGGGGYQQQESWSGGNQWGAQSQSWDQSSYSGQESANGYSGYGGYAGYGGAGYTQGSYAGYEQGYTASGAVGYPQSTAYPTQYPSAPAPSQVPPVAADQGYSGTNQQNFTQARGGYNQKAGGPMKQRGGARGGYRPY